MDPFETLEMLRQAEAFMYKPFDSEMCESLLSRSLHLEPSDREKLNEILGDHLSGILEATKQLRSFAQSLRGENIPKMAWEEALRSGGSDALRELACGDPWMAYRYAMEVDEGPRDETRTAACKDPKWAFEYALHVDRCPGDETRVAASEESYYALSYGNNVDKAPHEVTRRGACKTSRDALYYAREVDQSACPETREAADSEEYEMYFPPCDPPEACATHGRCWAHSTGFDDGWLGD